jgi:hypothetical protein
MQYTVSMHCCNSNSYHTYQKEYWTNFYLWTFPITSAVENRKQTEINKKKVTCLYVLNIRYLASWQPNWYRITAGYLKTMEIFSITQMWSMANTTRCTFCTGYNMVIPRCFTNGKQRLYLKHSLLLCISNDFYSGHTKCNISIQNRHVNKNN